MAWAATCTHLQGMQELAQLGTQLNALHETAAATLGMFMDLHDALVGSQQVGAREAAAQRLHAHSVHVRNTLCAGVCPRRGACGHTAAAAAGGSQQ